MYRKVPVRLGKGRWETYTTTVVKGTHRFLHGCYGRRNALLGTTKTADLTGPCPIKSDGYPSRILYSVSLQALKKGSNNLQEMAHTKGLRTVYLQVSLSVSARTISINDMLTIIEGSSILTSTNHTHPEFANLQRGNSK